MPKGLKTPRFLFVNTHLRTILTLEELLRLRFEKIVAETLWSRECLFRQLKKRNLSTILDFSKRQNNFLSLRSLIFDDIISLSRQFIPNLMLLPAKRKYNPLIALI